MSDAGTDDGVSDRVGDQEVAARELQELLAQRRKEEVDLKDSDERNIFTFDDGEKIDLRLPVDLSFAEGLPVDNEGYRPITWTQLKRKFFFEKPAHKFKLHGDISQREEQYWQRSKQIKVRDADGVEAALFFYDENPEPHFSYDDLRVGNTLTIRSPRLHRFMDGQEGMRLEEASAIARVGKVKTFTDAMRMDYGTLSKNNGTGFFTKQKYEDAMGQYSQAIEHLEGTFYEKPELEGPAKTMVAQCLLNIAACKVAEKKWQDVEAPCEKALVVNASPALNAKAYFRLGQACIELSLLTAAKQKLTRAAELAPGNTRIAEELARLHLLQSEQKSAQSELFASLKTRVARPDGMHPAFGFKPTPFSCMQTSLRSLPNFRDLSSVPLQLPAADPTTAPQASTAAASSGAAPRPKSIRPYLLYRSSSLFSAALEDMSRLQHELGVKTILDLRYEGEANLACTTACHQADRLLKMFLTLYPDEDREGKKDTKKKKDASSSSSSKHPTTDARLPPTPDVERRLPALPPADIPRPPLFVDYRHSFLPVAFTKRYFQDSGYLSAKQAVLARAKQPTPEALLAHNRVNFSIDFGSRSVIVLTAYWVLIAAAILTALFQFKRAARLVVTRTVQQVGVLRLYQSIIERQHLEIRQVCHVLAQPSSYPVLVSCSLGKDRTGIVAMLVLSLVGASDAAIASDFARTTACMTPEMQKMQALMGLGPEWNTAQPDTMLKLLAFIRAKYAGVEAYLTGTVKVPSGEIDQIRRILLG